MTLVYLAAALVTGVLLGSRYDAPLWMLAMALLPLPLLFIWRRHKKPVIVASLCLLALTGGMLRYQASLPTTDGSHVQSYNDAGTVTLKGVIANAPDIRDKSAHLTISAHEIDAGEGWHSVAGNVLVYVSRDTAYEYGDDLLLTGRLQTPPTLGEFDYRGYLQNQGIYSVMSFPQIQVVEQRRGFKPLALVYSLRVALADGMARVLPEPQASLAQGIILGMRRGIPQSVNDDFVRTGTAHILVISGMQFNIVAGMLTATGIWLFGKRRYTYVWLALAAIWVYALLTGMSAPVVRSAIMLSLFLCADLLGRQKSVLPALAFAAAIMVAISPRALSDASFQLSFMATLGLALTAPPLQAFGRRWVGRLGEKGLGVSTLNWVADNVAVTVGVMLLIWPVLLQYFGVLSPVAPLATLLLLPALPAVLLTGALAAGLGAILPAAGVAAGWLAWPFLSYMLLVIRGAALLPAAAIDLGSLQPWVVWGYFAVLAVALLAYHRRRQVKAIVTRAVDSLARVPMKWAAPPLLTVTIVALAFAGAQPDGRTHVSFLDVGQGDAILIRTPLRQDILIDGGPSPQAIAVALSRQMPFWDRTIELVVLTHPHADHLAGLVEVLKRYRVQQVLIPASGGDSPLWAEWQALLQKEGAAITVARLGQVIDLGQESITIEVLSAAGGSAPTLDFGGTVLKVTSGRVSFLLTADIPQETELDLVLQRAPLHSAVLKVAHHGSYTASSPGFLAVVDPEVAVISVGAGNDYGHPNQEVMRRLTGAVGKDHIYRTDQDGTIEFTTDGERLWVETQARR